MAAIDIRREQLLPLTELGNYLASRGFGRRVCLATAYRWASHGCRGVVLETVRIGGLTLTTVEAVQRWVSNQQVSPRRTKEGADVAPSPTETAVPTLEHQTSVHLLVEHRVAPSPLDRLLATLPFPETTTRFTAGLLFRAGLRTPDDARQLGLARLLAIPGLGKKSRSVVQKLCVAMDG